MKINKKGFTLIELLVVVLVIGILAAVALPQYQLAVDKARVSKYLDMGRSIRDAQERYFMINNEYSLSLNRLDISFDPSCERDDYYVNMFFNCMSGEVSFNNTAEYGESIGVLDMFYCPSLRGVEQDSYQDCQTARELDIKIYYTYTKYVKHSQIACSGKTKRGKRICKALGF